MNKTIIIAVLIFTFAGIHAQEPQKLTRKERKALNKVKVVEETKKMIDSANFVFIPSQVLPISMRSRNVDGTFRAKIQNDSIDSYLPFFGRAYSADYSSTEGPFTFNLPIENYSKEKLKKEYLIKFDVKNMNDLVKFMFYISENGFTTLTINSTNRQGISYYGRIEKPEK